MNKFNTILAFSIGFTAITGVPSLFGQPKVFTLDPNMLEKVRESHPAKDRDLKAAYKKLLRDADKALALGPWTLMDKTQEPPSGDKHDFYSLSRYWWPDTSKPDGLPYVQRDGETNPESEAIPDEKYLNNVVKSVEALGLAYYFSGEEKYAEKAAAVLRTWFLDPKSRMNPNMNFGGVVKGKGKGGGRASGLISTRSLVRILDGVGLLEGSSSWTADDQKRLKAWFEIYFEWLTTSEIGTKEAATTNNHGVWYDVQAASIALFLDKKDIAANILNEAKTKRIGLQIQPDGQMPRELARTRSLHYTLFNLEAFFALATVAERVGIDLWNYQSEDGRGIRKALDFVLPFVLGEKKWEHEQLDEVKLDKQYDLSLQAAVKYNDLRYKKAADKNAGDDVEKDRANLLFKKD
jgi:hypothetical protein